MELELELDMNMDRSNLVYAETWTSNSAYHIKVRILRRLAWHYVTTPSCEECEKGWGGIARG